ncbi:fibroblast growth factor 2 isoform X2 [Protopterus annectens]|uniref:fibroblast growth factor 2 isoform X2 n=1 Tax=Protopterus annectens TaxID=7888 RepID=UPI001CFA1D3A|nr:fibroblast growth factor 2 isoform X2 [Protopterus annectens]
MATGGITTLPPVSEDGSNPFPPGNFKDPKKLYCKNGGYFLRINSDGSVDGVRDKNDPHRDQRPGIIPGLSPLPSWPGRRPTLSMSGCQW